MGKRPDILLPNTAAPYGEPTPGRRLFALRLLKGIKERADWVRRISDRVGDSVEYSTINNWENGRTQRFGGRLFEAACAILDVSIDDVLRGRQPATGWSSASSLAGHEAVEPIVEEAADEADPRPKSPALRGFNLAIGHFQRTKKPLNDEERDLAMELADVYARKRGPDAVSKGIISAIELERSGKLDLSTGEQSALDAASALDAELRKQDEVQGYKPLVPNGKSSGVAEPLAGYENSSDDEDDREPDPERTRPTPGGGKSKPRKKT